MSKKDRLRENDDSPPLACAGRSIVEILEDQLDAVYSNIMLANQKEIEATEEQVNLWKGQAQGYANSLAIFRNPYLPNVDQIRAETVVRWEASQEEDEMEEAGSFEDG